MSVVVQLPNQTSKSVLRLRDVQARYGDVTILNGITISITEGETVGLIGPNGCGKTTLFNCISGFTPISGGFIEFKGENICRYAPYKRSRKGVGRVFQNFGIFRDLTVLENVVLALESRPTAGTFIVPFSRSSRSMREEARALLKQVNLDDKAELKASSLSGGQMRLLEIMRMVGQGADLCLLDEPTAGVSPKMKDQVAALIRYLKSLGKTVLVIEHDIHFIQQFCNRIIVLDGGNVVLDDMPEKVRQNSMLQEIYFGAGNG